MIRGISLFALIVFASIAPAGEFNKVLSVGDAAPAWDGLVGTDGKKHALADLKEKPVVVVTFTCNSCPVAADYENRVAAFAKKHADQVAVVAINVNTIKEDLLPEMTKRAEKKKLPYAYLHDPSQQIAKQYGAIYTPEFFVLDRDRKVVYQGAMDDKSPPGEPTAEFLEAAVKAALAGKKPATLETLARGCKIRYVKKDE